MNTIFVLELKNSQEDYSVALDFIRIIEGKGSDSSLDKKKYVVKSRKKNFNI